MLAVITTDALYLVPPSVLKNGSPAHETVLTSVEERPTAVSWSPDGSGLFVASARSIHKYEPSAKDKYTIYATTELGSITHLLSKDRGNSQIFSAGSKVFILECGSGVGKVTKTFDSHKSNITSLSLSNDATLLATTSSDTAHVHNLTLSSHTVLRGLPLTGNQKITSSAFHSHSRGRLFLGIGKQMVIYDTTRPSAPLKLILMPEGTSGEIVAIACSPFSKTLVAVATTGGDVGLVDLEKDKSPRRNFSVKVPITSLVFSPEGDAIYIGTENGKVLIKSLRAMDKAPLTISVSHKGSRVEGMSVQKKTKVADTEPVLQGASIPPRQLADKQESTKRRPTSATEASKKAKSAFASKAGTYPGGIKSHASSAAAMKGTRAEAARAKGTLKDNDPASREEFREKEKQVFSPVRDPLGNSDSIGGDISVKIETIIGMKTTKAKAEARKPTIGRMQNATRATSRPTSIRADSPEPVSQPASVVSTQPLESIARTISRPTSARAASPDLVPQPASVVSAGGVESPRREPSRVRTNSTTSTRSKDPAINLNRQRMPSSSSATSVPSSSSSRPLSSMSSRSSYNSSKLHAISGISSRRTPSPELPSPDKEPMTPAPQALAKEKERRVKLKGVNVLGLGTPEVDAWVEAGKGKEKEKVESGTAGSVRRARVNFLGEELPPANRVNEKAPRQDLDSEPEQDEAGERSLVISPRRAPPQNTNTWAPVPSPLRSTPVSSPGHGSGSSAQDLLRTIVQDVMYDFQRDTKAEMMGLHLDLVRMRRAWRKEMQDTMLPHMEELRELREENKRLREENDRLRRGF
ncbi:WD40 repeat-like protein [Neolentinus lepideus HHB14362 ss-1]|uniref:WD40 repeat-like protein n=1 Tax=Neolentinus lepideus HHB14362 ss-1 TaxID=1314782 RepID=A0A165TXE6_9AGAM|nr:WD40 repeat-like protein [Neolentinus lepideus HHB14362 ss-1]